MPVKRKIAALWVAAVMMVGTATPATGAADWNLVSGQQLTHPSGQRCTFGFNTQNGANRYVLTSGLCAAIGGGTWSGIGGAIGPTLTYALPSYDFGVIRVTSAAAVPTPLVDRHSVGPDVTITGVETPTLGAKVCYSSPYIPFGWGCGRVTGTGQTACYIPECVHGLLRTDLCLDPGAVGAPVVTDPGTGTSVRAVGVITAPTAIGDDCAHGGSTYVQPIGRALGLYGLTLLTG
jgi:hypothetical protein